MQGTNRAISRAILGKAETAVACVFISHRAVDRAIASAIDIAIRSTGVDTYFDVTDAQLQSATSMGDAHRVTAQVDAALRASSHLLGIISQRTKGSWWVPYEIGAARHASKPTAHLISADAKELPEFIQASKVLLDLYDFRNWLESVGPRPIYASASLKKSMPNFSSPYISELRNLDQVRFTSSS